MENPAETTESSNKMEEFKKRLHEKVKDVIKEPIIEAQSNNCETSFVVLLPAPKGENIDKRKVLCYCDSKENAEFIFTSIKIASEMAMHLMLEKIFS